MLGCFGIAGNQVGPGKKFELPKKSNFFCSDGTRCAAEMADHLFKSLFQIMKNDSMIGIEKENIASSAILQFSRLSKINFNL